MLEVTRVALIVLATTLVFAATLPVLAGLYQFLAVGFSSGATHYESSGARFPRVSILIPAWNEGAVIGTTIDRLMRLDYPRDRLRIYVIDDASTEGVASMNILWYLEDACSSHPKLT